MQIPEKYTHKILDGKALAETIKEELAERVKAIVNTGGRPPHLAAILVGDDPASQVYVRNKVRSCDKVGLKSSLYHLEENTTEEDLLQLIKQLNNDDEIDGFIVQLPLPKHIDEHKITPAVDPMKDVDGFHPENIGKLALGLPSYLPATPYGIIEMLKRYDIPTEGKEVVVMGRSNIVGTPMGLIMARKGYPGNSTVTICHSRTKNLKLHTQRADILIAAIGQPEFITADMVSEGVVIIDVGINRVEDAEAKRGYRLVGDVDFDGVLPKCSYITPVPGGVGRMTVTALLMNTLDAYENQH